jgi:4-hydroxy-3-methylbut-2-enyl diphosphate reductase
VQVTIDSRSGFCFGVINAIEVAERELNETHRLFCLGDIVHNKREVERLEQSGLVIITHEEFNLLHDCKVMIRAHGEPPETYQRALENRIELIDASCPIVLNLQNTVRRSYLEMLAKNGQIVIFGKDGHAEVIALKGQTRGSAIVVGGEHDLESIDFMRPVRLYSQTTMSVEGFQKIVKIVGDRMQAAAGDGQVDFEWHDSICRQVSNRSVLLREFAARFDVVIFVSGRKSSNGMVLYQVCKEINPRTYMVSGSGELDRDWFTGVQTVGICGATSTPMWLMEEVARGTEIING